MDKKQYHKLILLLVSLIVILFISLFFGAFAISFNDIIKGNIDEQQKIILYSIRLPRILLASLVGAALATSGAVIQALFRNPLADPGLIGIAGGAAFGVGLVIVLFGSISGVISLYILGIAAFFGGLLTCLVIFAFARMVSFSGSFSVTYMLLAGIAINALLGSATGFLTYISNDQQLRTLTFWTMGNFGGALWSSVFVCTTFTLPIVFFLIYISRELNIFILGEDEAKYLGVNTEKLKRKIIICAALLVGVSVANSGIIGFVGLVVPHLVRIAISSNNKIVIPASAILGAVLTVVADDFARTIIAPSELPVGIVTSIIGGPFFLWILSRQYATKN